METLARPHQGRFLLGMGILSRLMPNMQVFFIIIPPQILMSFALLMASFSGMMLWYLDFAESHLSSYVGP